MKTAPMPEAARIRARRGDALAIAALAALTLVFFGRVLFTNQALFWGDVVMSIYPWYDLWKQGMASGHLPLWNPFVLGGFPVAADASAGYFYPSVLLTALMPPHRALAVELALHVFVAGAFTYLFLRRQDIAAGPALVGAVIFAFSGFMAVRVTQPSLIRTAAWLPLLLLIAAGLDARPRGRSALYLGLILATQLLAGHHQTVLISALLLGSYTIWQMSHRAGPGQNRLRALASVVPTYALAVLVAAALAAVQLIPAIELSRHSDRSGGMDFGSASLFSLPLEQLPMLLAPKLFGDPTTGRYWGKELFWEMTGYAGLVAILLAVLGAVVSIRRDRIFWAAIALGGIALALGRYTPLYWLAYYLVPGLAYFRVPARFLLWFAFAVAILAAYGMDALRAGTGSRSAWRWVTVCLLAGGIAGAVLAVDAPGVRSAIRWLASPALRLPAAAAAPSEVVRYLQDSAVREGPRFVLLWTLGAMAVLAVRMRRMSFRTCAPVLLLLVGADLFTFGMNIYPTVDPQALSRPVPTARVLDLEQGTYRIVMAPAFVNQIWTQHMTGSFVPVEPDWLFKYRTALIPNTNVHRQIPNAYGYSPVYVRRFGQFLATAIQLAQRGGGSPLQDFVGARYVFTFEDLGYTHQQVYHGSFYVWRNERAMPRGWLVTNYEVLTTDAQVARAFRTDWDPSQTVILSQSPRDTFGLRPREDAGKITRRSFGLTRAAFDLALTGPAIFVLSDTYYPGWRAYVDGAPHPIYRANHAFRAVFLPAGARHLEFVYQPRGVMVGGIVSGLGWLCVCAMLVAGAVRTATYRTAMA